MNDAIKCNCCAKFLFGPEDIYKVTIWHDNWNEKHTLCEKCFDDLECRIRNGELEYREVDAWA